MFRRLRRWNATTQTFAAHIANATARAHLTENALTVPVWGGPAATGRAETVSSRERGRHDAPAQPQPRAGRFSPRKGERICETRQKP